jgi:hypothetical protein
MLCQVGEDGIDGKEAGGCNLCSICVLRCVHVSLLCTGHRNELTCPSHLLRSAVTTSRLQEYLPRLPELPKLSLEYGEKKSLYNESKLALLIENRPQGIIAPMMLHFMAVLPPDWKFRFMGSEESVAHVNKSAAVRRQARAGKLDLTYIPRNMSVNGQEEISRFLTTLWLYDTVLQPAEWLLVYQTDSMQEPLADYPEGG